MRAVYIYWTHKLSHGIVYNSNDNSSQVARDSESGSRGVVPDGWDDERDNSVASGSA
jgi:hypothetical protein